MNPPGDRARPEKATRSGEFFVLNRGERTVRPGAAGGSTRIPGSTDEGWEWIVPPGVAVDRTRHHVSTLPELWPWRRSSPGVSSVTPHCYEGEVLMSRVIAVANQKGGVAKTTSVVSLGAAFAELGLRVLLVDLDAQSSLTFSLGIDPDAVETSIADVLIGDSDLAATTLAAGESLSLVPATIDLAGVEAMMLAAEGREFVLRRVLEPVLSSYDVILLDCSPSLGLLTLNALAAADEVIIPCSARCSATEGSGSCWTQWPTCTGS